MRNKWLRRMFTTAVVALVASFANTASAWYGSWGSSGGSSGGYGGYYGSGGRYGSSGGYGVSYGSSGGYSGGYGSSGLYGGSSGGYERHVGPVRRLLSHIHNHVHDHFAAKAARRSAYYGSQGVPYIASYGSSGGGSSGGSYAPVSYGHGSSGGSSGYSSGAYGSSGGVSHGSSGGTLNYGTYDYVPTMPEAAPTTIPMIPSGSGVSTNISSGKVVSHGSAPDEIHLVVNLPGEAKMFVNGNATTSTGSSRHFVSKNLVEGDNYRFELRAVITDAKGQSLEKTKTLVLKTGQGGEVTFDMSTLDEPAETVLTLNVPEDAQVVLADNPTKSVGSSRVYRTRQLRDGESWDDYRVVVTHEGITKEKVIRLIGGDKLELTFNFEEASQEKVAMK
ncbi:MAG: TIGR03000 domain-containing protein [Planctomycetes bacterium]|nr:TIGR03000 domain-containing protein [Planctomycetota bacterium]